MYTQSQGATLIQIILIVAIWLDIIPILRDGIKAYHIYAYPSYYTYVKKLIPLVILNNLHGGD